MSKHVASKPSPAAALTMRMKSSGTQYLSTANAAQYLGVGPTSVKRWADLGLLKCVRTAGNHRRFLREEVERFARAVQSGQVALEAAPARHEPAPPVDHARAPLSSDDRVHGWTDRILQLGAFGLHGALLAEREILGSWWRVADLVGAALGELGERWECGRVTIIQEHLASERLARALARCTESLPAAPGAPVAVLAAVEPDEHTLGLSLAELVLREAGHATDWIGRRTPGRDLAAHVQVTRPAVVALSASQVSADPEVLRPAVLPLARVCRDSGVRLLLGGAGRWPGDVPGAVRLHDFAGLHAFLAGDGGRAE